MGEGMIPTESRVRENRTPGSTSRGVETDRDNGPGDPVEPGCRPMDTPLRRSGNRITP